jgi:hypothetical protein
MKVAGPCEFTDQDRQLVARFLGYERPATHIECMAWARGQLRGSLAVMATAPKRPWPAVPPNRVIREGESEPRHE